MGKATSMRNRITFTVPKHKLMKADETYEKLLKKLNFHLANLGDVILLFQDEALIKFHPALSRCWNKIGERKEVQTFDNHGKSAIFGSVNPFTGELIHTYGNTINQIFFLEHLNE